MPSAYVRNLAKETGKSTAEIEKLWKKAKEITAETLGTKEVDFTSKEYKYTVGIVKNMLGVKEEIIDPSNFLKSDMNAKEYLEAVLVSSNFSIGSMHGPPPEEDEVEEETDEDDLGIVDALSQEKDDDEENDEEESDELEKEEDDEYPVDELDKMLDFSM